MNKKIIRLTESELKQVISESVKQVISELDWKTYNNAARKRNEQGAYSKGGDLYVYANKKFDQQHGYYGKPEPIGCAEIVGRDDLTGVSLRYGPSPNSKYLRDTTYRTYIDDEDGNYKSLRIKPFDQCEVKHLDRVPPPHLQRAHNEYRNYMNGNYEYTKGKGWHLKDKM